MGHPVDILLLPGLRSYRS